jgi:hypothetical protein
VLRSSDIAADSFLASLASGDYQSVAVAPLPASAFAPPADDMSTDDLLAGITRGVTADQWGRAI